MYIASSMTNDGNLLSFILPGGAFDGVEDVVSPFGYRKGEGIDAGCGEVDWICNRDRERTDPLFESLKPIDGKISGAGKSYQAGIHSLCTRLTTYSTFF